jgi:serine protease Do
MRFAITILTALLGLGSTCHGQQEPTTINLRRSVTVDVVARTKDAVVNISATKMVNRRVSPFGNDPFWQDFGPGEVIKVPANSLGSGFIVHPNGYLVTNNHVIDRARQVSVELADGRKLQADLISADPEADLAVLKIRTDQPLPALSLGDSSDLLIGEPVIAVGNPLGFSHSVSTGIVSAIHRDLKDNANRVLMGDLVQTDAAINPGNSGGPLLNAYGQVIGINTAIRGDAQNIGFAVPVSRLRDLIPELMNPAVVNKVEVPLKLTEKRTLEPPSTVKATVQDATSEAKRVKAIDGVEVKDIVDAYALLLKVRPETKSIEVTYDDGKTRSLAVKPVPLPDAVVKAKEKFGVGVEMLTPMLAERYRLQAEQGLFVREVARDSAAQKAGIQTGDVIVQMGRYRVTSLADFSALLQHMPESGRVRMGVIRGDKLGFAIVDF